MEAADVDEDARPPHRGSALGAWRQVHIKAAVLRRGRVAKNVGVPPFNDIVHVHARRGRAEREVRDGDDANRWLGLWRSFAAGEEADEDGGHHPDARLHGHRHLLQMSGKVFGMLLVLLEKLEPRLQQGLKFAVRGIGDQHRRERAVDGLVICDFVLRIGFVEGASV